VLSNHDLERMVDTSNEWIIERTGIEERRMYDKSVIKSDLAVEAARMALDAAYLKRKIDLILWRRRRLT
jgi:3-oxoacyl-[acyl-carrier-protein] synthase-3